MDDILVIDDICKQFISTTALDHVSLRVPRGATLALLGPNGAGKTTLLRIINGLLAIDSGSVTIDGQPVSLDTTHHIGYMPEERGLYDNMTVENQILFFGRLKDGDPVRMRKVMQEYIALFNLSGQERRKVKELSKGNQQKVQIISTLVHEPKLVILDEPFSGFDPINGALLQQLIGRLQGNGTTIILSSHNMHAVEEMCSDIALINKGHLLVNGPLQDIKEANKSNHILITVSSPLNEGLCETSGLFEELTSVRSPHGRKGFSYRLRKKDGIRNVDLINELAVQAEVTRFEEELPTLSDLFLKYTGSN